MTFLRDFLGEDAIPQPIVMAEAARRGIKHRTLVRAKAEAGVRSVRIGPNGWGWALSNEVGNEPVENATEAEYLTPIKPVSLAGVLSLEDRFTAVARRVKQLPQDSPKRLQVAEITNAIRARNRIPPGTGITSGYVHVQEIDRLEAILDG